MNENSKIKEVATTVLEIPVEETAICSSIDEQILYMRADVSDLLYEIDNNPALHEAMRSEVKMRVSILSSLEVLKFQNNYNWLDIICRGFLRKNLFS